METVAEAVDKLDMAKDVTEDTADVFHVVDDNNQLVR